MLNNQSRTRQDINKQYLESIHTLQYYGHKFRDLSIRPTAEQHYFPQRILLFRESKPYPYKKAVRINTFPANLNIVNTLTLGTFSENSHSQSNRVLHLGLRSRCRRYYLYYIPHAPSTGFRTCPTFSHVCAGICNHTPQLEMLGKTWDSVSVVQMVEQMADY